MEDEYGQYGDGTEKTWKTYLYQLQLKAPRPRKVLCQYEVANRPIYYGKEYHGAISRSDTERLVSQCDGCFLVRESQRAAGAYTLAISFDGQTKNYKLYHDGQQHYVGEKRFDNITDLVADGLITFYLESRAADYIAQLSNQSNYAESPYMAYYNSKKSLQKNRDTTDAGDANASTTEKSKNTYDFSEPCVQDYEKPHVFKVHTFKGLHWCDFCANFMWGIIAQGSKCQDCGFQAHKKCSEHVPNDCCPDMKYVKRIFGADLTTLVKAQNSTTPAVLEKCVKEVETRGLDVEGLYRVNGFHDDIEAIRMAFDKDADAVDISAAKYDDHNTITSVLKLYLRLLPIPLVTFDAYPKFIEAAKADGLTEKESINRLRDGVLLLPPAHYQTLKYLLQHLARVIEKSHINMMIAENLAIVFAPTLLRAPGIDPMTCLLNAKIEQRAMEMLLNSHKELFTRNT